MHRLGTWQRPNLLTDVPRAGPEALLPTDRALVGIHQVAEEFPASRDLTRHVGCMGQSGVGLGGRVCTSEPRTGETDCELKSLLWVVRGAQ